MADSARLRSRFIRVVLESFQRYTGGNALPRLRARLPERLQNVLASRVLKARESTETVSLSDGAELLLSMDEICGDSRGELMQRAAEDLGRRILLESSALAHSELADTVARLRAPLEHPFVQVPVLFQLEPSRTGFHLTVGVEGYPRAARVLEAFAIGYIRAAAPFFGHRVRDALEISSSVVTDRAFIEARYETRRSTLSQHPEPIVRPHIDRRALKRRPSSVQKSLVAEVERILNRASQPPEARSLSPAPFSRAPTPTPGSVRPSNDSMASRATAVRATNSSQNDGLPPGAERYRSSRPHDERMAAGRDSAANHNSLRRPATSQNGDAPAERDSAASPATQAVVTQAVVTQAVASDGLASDGLWRRATIPKAPRIPEFDTSSSSNRGDGPPKPAATPTGTDVADRVRR